MTYQEMTDHIMSHNMQYEEFLMHDLSKEELLSSSVPNEVPLSNEVSKMRLRSHVSKEEPLSHGVSTKELLLSTNIATPNVDIGNDNKLYHRKTEIIEKDPVKDCDLMSDYYSTSENHQDEKQQGASTLDMLSEETRSSPQVMSSEKALSRDIEKSSNGQLAEDSTSNKAKETIPLDGNTSPNPLQMAMHTESEVQNPKSRRTHKKKTHKHTKVYTCPVCGKRFRDNSNMKSHLKLHSGIKPYLCNICGAKFARAFSLKRHARLHGISADEIWKMYTSDSKSTKNLVSNTSVALHPQTSSSQNVNKINNPDSPFSDGSLLKETSTASTCNEIPGSNDKQITSLTDPSSPISSLHRYSDRMSHSTDFVAANLSSKHDTFNDINRMSVGQANQNCTDFIPPSSEDLTSLQLINRSAMSSPVKSSSQFTSKSMCDKESHVNICCDTRPDSFHERSGNTCKVYQTSSDFEHAIVSASTLDTEQLFKCKHCQCYFSDYSTYRIHLKVHVAGDTMPFLCPVCKENCYERVYFMLHISEHLQ